MSRALDGVERHRVAVNFDNHSVRCGAVRRVFCFLESYGAVRCNRTAPQDKNAPYQALMMFSALYGVERHRTKPSYWSWLCRV